MIQPARETLAGEPAWTFPAPRGGHCSGDEAAGLLRSLEDEDLDLMVLAYGLGLRVGPLSQALRIDPALVVWRLHRAFSRWSRVGGGGQEPGCMERAVADLLRGRATVTLPPPAGRAGWSVDELLEGLDESVQARLTARLADPEGEINQAGGVGIGLAVVVLGVALGFLAFGIVRDVDPMRRGNALMQQYEYRLAREAFLKVGTVQARTRVVLCLLAEGRFQQALTELADPEVRALFKQFAPTTPVPIDLDLPAQSRALLPRGLTITPRPPFVLRSGPAGQLVLSVGGRELRLELPDTRGEGAGTFVVEYPESWPTLATGRVMWRVEDGDDNPGVFDVGDRELARRVRERNWRVLTREVPQRAQLFLRAHHFMSEGLLMQAGWQFARLAETFPAEPYPRQQVWAVAAALGIDPTALLR